MTPPELGAEPLSEALINIRLTLRRAVRAPIVPGDLRRALEEIARATHFVDRSYARLLDQAPIHPAARMARRARPSRRLAPRQCPRPEAGGRGRSADPPRAPTRACWTMRPTAPPFRMTEAWAYDLDAAGLWSDGDRILAMNARSALTLRTKRLTRDYWVPCHARSRREGAACMDAAALWQPEALPEVSRLGTRFLVFPQPPFIPGYERPEIVWVSTPPDRIGPGPADRPHVRGRPAESKAALPVPLSAALCRPLPSAGRGRAGRPLRPFPLGLARIRGGACLCLRAARARHLRELSRAGDPLVLRADL